LPGRGLAAAACLVFIALAFLAVLRKLERERRLLRKLRKIGAVDPDSAVSVHALSADEQDCAASLANAGVLTVRQARCHLRAAELPLFRRKRVRLALSGLFGGLLLCMLVAVLILRR
jgi:hypothetical protein